MSSNSKSTFKRVVPYADDAMNLPVRDVDAAIPYYEKTFAFRVVSRQEAPHKSVVLARDEIQIGLAENGGDPEQDERHRQCEQHGVDGMHAGGSGFSRAFSAEVGTGSAQKMRQTYGT